MDLLECRAAFLYCTGDQYGRYNYEAIATYRKETGTKDEFEYVHRKLILRFQPFESAYYITNFYLNTEGATIVKGKINTPNNPLPQHLQEEQWSAIRSVFDNYDQLKPCRSTKGDEKAMKHFRVSGGQFFITEIDKIRSIDFQQFIKKHGDKQAVIAENGTINF